ncbi:MULTISPECIES: endonuclease NucS domain-containing protein [Cyanophyceae]|uniref:endonuclease NucS domain-containing protein n=1 Tax=Cyanophyceae TaxID=3028117 RepID=UPI001683AB38|nr:MULTISPECIES: endonuclease NucS domain-containing protein [Cyanophyceae]MBD1914272.1 DUF91 domain-containing protein [Phormidium sp. FACHB-77]MBD2031207.1 DUF91 domain-containing protein [Phormidium sp. FACHB-322]MBD2049606.1 DUF91 domain-containing protein [Leptolyngbya sp. FACHB-60]
MTDWAFKTEFNLEEFIWANLGALFGLEPLARQYGIKGQICDILATTSEQQLVVLELKNIEDRYVVQQLTRYYASLRHAQPFPDQIDYSLPIRLVAIAPTFHAHNHIDREYNRLDFEFYRFTIIGDGERFRFQLVHADSAAETAVEVEPSFHPYLQTTGAAPALQTSARVIGRPPKSLRMRLEGIKPESAAVVSALRLQILEFDERMREVGLTSRTLYGLAKGEKEIYKTKLCAEFWATHVGTLPELYLRLPYPKRVIQQPGYSYIRGKAKGFAWASVSLWLTERIVFFYLSKSRSRYSYKLSYSDYANLCEPLLGHRPQLDSFEDLVALALAEWKQIVGE